MAVAERNDPRQMSDEDLLRWSRGAERVLVTENVQDLLPLHGEVLNHGGEVLNHGESHAGIVLPSPTRFPRSTAGIGTLVIALARLLEERTHPWCLGSEVLWL